MHEGVHWQAYFARFTRGKYFQQRAMTHPSTAVERAQLLLLQEARTHLDVMIRRSVMVPLELPLWRQMADQVEVICAAAGHVAVDDQASGPRDQDREGDTHGQDNPRHNFQGLCHSR